MQTKTTKQFLKIDGQPKEIRFTAKNICLLEAELGESVIGNHDISFTKLTRYAWAGLRDSYPDSTPDEIADLLDSSVGDWSLVLSTVLMAWVNAFGASGDDSKKKQLLPIVQDSLGVNSTESEPSLGSSPTNSMDAHREKSPTDPMPSIEREMSGVRS